jgi:predicted RNase H-like HicB family nuclease
MEHLQRIMKAIEKEKGIRGIREVNKMSVYKFSVVIEKDSAGYYAFCPELQGCYTQGDTYEETLENIKDTIRLHIEDRVESGEEIPQSESVSLTLMEVAV